MFTSLFFPVPDFVASGKPVVRNQTVVHLLEWLKIHCHHFEMDMFDLVKVSDVNEYFGIA